MKFYFPKKHLFFLILALFAFHNISHALETTAVQKIKGVFPQPDIPVKFTQVIKMPGIVARIAVDSKGNIYANVGKINTVTIYNPMGEKEGEITLQEPNCLPPYEHELTTITGMDIDLNDDIYLVNAAHRAIEKFSKAGDFIKKISLPASPKKDWIGVQDVVVDADGALYIPAYYKFMYIFNKEGNLQEQWAKSKNEKDQYGGLSAVAIDRYKSSRQKRIYVGDGYGNRVYVFDKNKKLLFTFGSRGEGRGEFLGISGIDIDSYGNIYVLDRNMGYCSVFSPDGKFLFRFGHEETGDSNLYYPMSIFIDQKDKIYISNSNKECIVVYEWKAERKK